eukprot:snap_masked-scaffold_1-processed-gene-32.12-mRNA-1 protein AED:1.00 eAED:1.00 QI:0/-1/0/0/-1/1/1/0/246
MTLHRFFMTADKGEYLIPAAILAGAAGVALGSVLTQSDLLKRKTKKKKLRDYRKITKEFGFDKILDEFPKDVKDVEALFKRDLPRLEGLSEAEVRQMVNDISMVFKETNPSFDEREVRRVILGCSTQAVLAQVLGLLMEEEKIVCRELKARKRKNHVFGSLVNNSHAKNKGKIVQEDTLLLHNILRAEADVKNFKITYSLEWRVVDTVNPEKLVGKWKAKFILKFSIIPNKVAVEGYLVAVRQAMF